MIGLRRGSALIGWLAGIALLHSLVWLGATELLSRGFGRWSEARQAEGWVLRHPEPARAGWPWRASLELAALDVTIPSIGFTGPWAVQLAAVEIGVDAAAPLELRGTARLSALASPALPQATAENITARLPWRGTDPAELVLSRIALEGGGGAAAARLLRHPDGRLSVSASSVDLPDRIDAPLGRRIEGVGVVLRADPGWPGTDPAAWRASRSVLRIDELELAYGPLKVEGAGTVSLDADLQPEGRANLEARGLAEVLRLLVAAGRIRQRDAALGRLVLFGLERRAAPGTEASVPLALDVSGRRLRANGFEVATVPLLVWPSRLAPVRVEPLTP